MKASVLLFTVLGCGLAKPNGYYHQEYNYKTSSSHYKNNELQHQTDDQGYFKKDGDLEGRVRPRVDANSEHSEYVNPNLRNGDYNTGLVGGANGDMSSYGHMRANSGSYGSRDLSSEGLAHTDHIGGNTGAYSGYSGSYGSSSYGSSSHNYGTSSNLRSVTSGIQHDLERDLQRAIQENRSYSQSRVSVADLERELRQNLTNRLNAELQNRYGQQSVRGGMSYTISGGRLHSTANYDNQELQDLRGQLESTLLNQLRTQYYQTSQQGSYDSYRYSTTTLRPNYYTHYPATFRPVTTIRTSYPVDYNQNIQYSPVSNADSITSIASRVQNQLDNRLNELLDDVQRRYFSSSSSYSLTNTDVILENLRNELKNNITYLLNENIKVNYGSQIPRDGYMYSVGPSGQTSTQYNYSIRDLENLRTQIERNLLEKLNRDFERYKTRWHQQSYSSSHSNQNSGSVQYGGYSTPRYVSYSTPRYDFDSTPRYNSNAEPISTRPSSSHLAPLITSGGGYRQVAGSSQSGYEISGSSATSMTQLQRQLQQDLSRQLQAAINRDRYSSYSSSGTYNPQSYQVSLQQLTDELNRNLTRQLQEYSAGGYYSAHGNFDQAQLATLRSQLQSDLLRQLQQGLQQSYHSSSSYSASSSSSSSNSNYRPVRGFDNYQSGQYRSGGNYLTMDGADCVGDDPNAYTHRMKRHTIPYRSQPIGISYSGRHSAHDYGYGYGANYGYHGHNYNHQQQLGQQVDDSDLTQQVEEIPGVSGQSQVELGQQVDDSDLTQQVEDSGAGKLQFGAHYQDNYLGQQTDDSDLTQQVEDSGYGQLQVGAQYQENHLGQQTDDSDLTQQVEDSGYDKLHVGAQYQENHLGQQTDDSDLTQQVEDSGRGRFQLGSQNQISLGQQTDDSDLTQQVEDSGFGRFQQSPQSQISLGQQTDDSDLTQQVEDSEFGRYQENPQSQINLGQQTDDSDLTQQVEESAFGRYQQSPQSQVNLGQQTDDSDLTQQVENSGFGRLQIGSQNHLTNLGQQTDDSLAQGQIGLEQEVDNSGLTQTDNSGYGKLQIGSQIQTQNGLDQQAVSSQVENVDHPGQLGQETDHSDLTQQVEEVNFGDSHYQTENDDLTQQEQKPGFDYFQNSFQGQPQNSNLNQEKKDRLELGQEEENTDTQQVENNSLLDNTQAGQSVDNSDVIQQVEDVNSHENVYNQQGLNTQYGRGDQPAEGNGGFPSQNQRETNLGQDSNRYRPIQYGLDSTSTQQDTDSQVVQQQENNFEGQQSGGLTQQVENSQISQQPTQYYQRQHPNSGLLYNERPLDVQVTSQQSIGDLSSQSQTGTNYQNQFYKPYTSRIQFGNRPINRNPSYNNNFIQTEVDQQKYLYSHQDSVGRPNSSPGSSSPVNELTQQPQNEFTDDQQQTIDLSPQGSAVSSDSGISAESNQFPALSQTISSTSNQNHEPQGSSAGQLQTVNNQDQDLTQSQSLADIEHQNDLLIQALQQHRARQSQTVYTYATSESSLPHGNLNQDNVRWYSSNQQGSFQTYLNNQQVQSALQLENELSKQVQDAISQNQYTITYSTSGRIDPRSFQTVYEQLLQELQRNITRQLQQTYGGEAQSSYSGYSFNSYGNLTPEQRQKLINQLEADLSRQLRYNLRISYSNQHDTEDTSFAGSPSYGSRPATIQSGSGSNLNSPYGPSGYIHYGHQETLPETEQVAPLVPIEPQQPSVVQDVRPQVPNPNIGVKGHGTYSGNFNSRPYFPQQPIEPPQRTPVEDAEVLQPESELPQENFPPAPSNPVPDVSENTAQQTVTQENLPWWKRFGNKVRDGATSLKEKIIG